MSETAVAFAGVGRASIETAIAFAGKKWAFLVQFSGAEVMVVSMVAVQGRAVVLLVSMSPRCRASCAKKFALRCCLIVKARKISPSALKTPQHRRFYACWASFFAEELLEGPCWASFFAEMPLEGPCWANFFAPIGPAPRSCRRRDARGSLRWGFCSIRNWLPACRRRVTPLMTPFPPLRGAEVAA